MAQVKKETGEDVRNAGLELHTLTRIFPPEAQHWMYV